MVDEVIYPLCTCYGLMGQADSLKERWKEGLSCRSSIINSDAATEGNIASGVASAISLRLFVMYALRVTREAKTVKTPKKGPHCCRNGHRFDLGYQRQFQCYMNHKGVGFQKM